MKGKMMPDFQNDLDRMFRNFLVNDHALSAMQNAASIANRPRRAQEAGLKRPARAEAEKKAEARRDTLPNANATHPSAMAKDLYATTGNREKRGSRAAVFCLFK